MGEVFARARIFIVVITRGGFWLSGETSGSAADDVVMASLSTAEGLSRGEEG